MTVTERPSSWFNLRERKGASTLLALLVLTLLMVGAAMPVLLWNALITVLLVVGYWAVWRHNRSKRRNVGPMPENSRPRSGIAPPS